MSQPRFLFSCYFLPLALTSLIAVEKGPLKLRQAAMDRAEDRQASDVAVSSICGANRTQAQRRLWDTSS